MTKFGAATDSALTTLGVVVGAGVLLSVMTLVPPDTVTDPQAGDAAGALAGSGGADPSLDGLGGTDAAGGVAAAGDTAAAGGTTGAAGGGGTSTNGGSDGKGGGGPGPSVSCAAGQNGGSTDVGVTATSIKLAATVVDDGPGASFLAPVRVGMDAVVNKTNRAGGVCGRQLALSLRNDSWDASTGQRFIQNFVESDKVFALAVVPSSEGLRAADSYIASKGVPVVGTDGMLIHQYQNPWIWPVATSTISTMHIMAQNAYDRGARDVGLVFDAKYHFGVEGAFAFNAAVKRLTGQDIDGFDSSLKSCQGKFCGIQPGQSSYASQARQFNDACAGCDFTAYLLEPDTAVAWFREGRRTNPPVGIGGAQPLFNRSFAETCGRPCDGMWVWTGYRPPIGSFTGEPAVAAYVADVERESSSVDAANQFVEGGYIGMNLLVTALQETGPQLTRARLRATLDSITYNSGLTKPLRWGEGRHFANDSAIAFEIGYKQSFNGWRNVTPFLPDPWVGQDIPPGA